MTFSFVLNYVHRTIEMVSNDFDLKTEDLNERTTLHTSQNASSKNGLNKESVLAKYEETNQNDEIEGFENLNDLSFSKYSKFSKASIIVGSDPKSRTSTLDSPFAKKLKEDLNVEFTSDNTKPYYPTVYPIYEFDNNDENSDSPFLDYQNEKDIFLRNLVDRNSASNNSNSNSNQKLKKTLNRAINMPGCNLHLNISELLQSKYR